MYTFSKYTGRNTVNLVGMIGVGCKVTAVRTPCTPVRHCPAKSVHIEATSDFYSSLSPGRGVPDLPVEIFRRRESIKNNQRMIGEHLASITSRL